MLLGARDLPALALGCSLLGSGGGGDVQVARLIAQRALEATPVQVLDPVECSPGDRVTMVAIIGSPTVFAERLPAAGQLADAVRALERHTRERFAMLAPFEIGGLNGLMAVAAAAEAGLSLLDCDAMGRAFPRLDTTVLTGRLPATPLALAGATGVSMVLDGADAGTAEQAVRSVLPAFGGWAAMALHPTRVEMLRRSAVPGSVTRALRLGVSLAEMDFRSPVAPGVVHEVRRRAGGGDAVVDLEDGGCLRVDFADEYVLATVDGEPVGSAPDVLCLVDTRTLRPVLVEALARGQRVRLLQVAAPPELRRRGDILGLGAYGMEDVEVTP